MNEDTLLPIIKHHLEIITSDPAELHVTTDLVEDLGLDDECFDYFLIDLQDATPLPDLSSLVLRSSHTIGELIEDIVGLIIT